jgi:patatin-like phospholipase/acyl hydrolase
VLLAVLNITLFSVVEFGKMAEEKPEKKLRLLCIDGGGVRGLSALFILKQLMEAVNRRNPPKPCNYFDMIGGTSTGG